MNGSGYVTEEYICKSTALFPPGYTNWREVVGLWLKAYPEGRVKTLVHGDGELYEHMDEKLSRDLRGVGIDA